MVQGNREEKSLCHVTMAAKLLDLNKPWSCKCRLVRLHLSSCISQYQLIGERTSTVLNMLSSLNILLGSLRCRYGNGNENVKKAKG